MKKTKKALASLAIASMVMTAIPFNAFADAGVTTARLSGSDRVGTAVAVADAGWKSADTAILAPSADANLVDALAAAPLAGKNAPILLTDNNTLTAATQAELVKLGVKNVYVVGAISQTVVDQVKAMTGVTATVLKGTDRIGTAAAISAKLTAPAGSFVVGYGALADALSVASYAAANNYSILVANPDGSLPASEAAFKGATTYIVGGPTLVADIPGATRLYGADRFATNQAVLKALTYKYDKAYVANGTDAHLVDSLVASSLAAESGAPIVLGDTNSALAATDIHAKLASNAVVTALGGSSVVPDAVVAQVVNGTVVVPPVNSNVAISNLTVSGQTVGDGSATSPAVVPINQGATFSATVSGAPVANTNMTVLVSTSTNMTATSNGQTLSATTLNTPVLIGSDSFGASYSVPTDASGKVSVTFSSTSSSNTSFNVVIQAPYNNNGQAVRSTEARAQWAVPGTLVLSPIYTSGSPDNLNFSNSSVATRGLVPVVATVMPVAGSTTPVSGQAVTFTMNANASDVKGSATAFFTDATGTGMLAPNVTVGDTTKATTATYNATTNANGQALIYINANQPSSNGVTNLASSIKVNVQAKLVNGGGQTNPGYYKWQSVSQPVKVASFSPSNMLNDTGITSPSTTVVNTAAQTATSGSQLTFSGVLEDAAGNPVTGYTLALQDYDVNGVNSSSNNIQNDAFVQNGTTTLFGSTAFPIVTTDSNGNFSFTVTANVSVTSSVYNSVTKYYLYGIPNTVAIANGQSLQPASPTNPITEMSFTGNSNLADAYGDTNYVSVVWQQGQTLQALGISTSALLSQYNGLTAVPNTNVSATNVVGSAQKVYVGGYNQNGQLVAPTSTGNGNQFANYGLDYSINVPSGMQISNIGATAFTSLAGYSLATTVTQADFHYYGGKLYLESVNNGSITGEVAVADTSAYDGSGQLMFQVNSTGATSVAGAVNASVAAYSQVTTGAGSWTAASTTTPANGQGAASGSMTATFTDASTIASLGAGANIGQITNFPPLIATNAAPGNKVSVSGTALDGASMSSNAQFVVAPFNNYVAMSSIPSQGLTYSLSASKSGKFRYIDGYNLANATQSAQVTVQQNGAVFVNNTPIWSVPSGSTVVAYSYDTVTSTVYTLVQGAKGATTTPFTLYPVVNSTTNGTAVATWSVPNNSLPDNFEGYTGFEFVGPAATGSAQSYKLILVDSKNNATTYAAAASASAILPASMVGGTAYPSLTGNYMTPVQAVTVFVSDKLSETPVVTITNSQNSQAAAVATSFTSATTGLSVVPSNPLSVNFAKGSSQNVTLYAMDQYGSPLANQTLYLQGTATNGLWITSVNGSPIMQTINLGGSGSSSFSNVATPVPMFVYSAEGLTVPTYPSVYVPGALTASNVNNGSNPYVSVVTGVDGTVSITLQDGNVAYYSGISGAAQIAVDPGATANGSIAIYSTNTSGTLSGPVGSFSVTIH